MYGVIVLNGNAEKFSTVISGIKEISSSEILGDKINLILENPRETNPAIIRLLIEAGAEIVYFNEIKASLEEIYLDLIRS